MKQIFQDEQFAQPGTVRGRVKWFDPGKGFGFILAESGGPDILLHVNVLRNFGQNSIADGAGIMVTVTETSRGMQAVEVLGIDPPPASESLPADESSGLLPEVLASLPLEPARVKWFDKSKGFGFANVFRRGEDVFLHVEVLRRSGFSEVQPGEALALRVTEGSRGRLAVQAAPWEAGLRDPALDAEGSGASGTGSDGGGDTSDRG